MRLKLLDGHVDASRALDEDQTIDVSLRFFMHDVANSQWFIFDQTNTT